MSWVVEKAKEVSLDFDACIKVMGDAKEVLDEELRKRRGRWVTEVRDLCPYVIVGDLHGDLETLSKILSRISHESLAKGEIRLAFLGDYVDRGLYQLETLLAVLILKTEFPDHIILLRGNHEPPKSLKPYPHDYPSVLRSRFGYVKSLELYERSLEVFDVLPLVAVVKDAFVMLHGGLPTEMFRREVSLLEYFMGKSPGGSFSLLIEILWNDPVESNYVRAPSPRGAGYLFGRVVTEWFLKRFRLHAVFRGHEAVDRGYKLNHGKRVITLFSRLGPPYYNSRASYAVVDPTLNRWWARIANFIVTLGL